MDEEKRVRGFALVLAGGGGKGAYEIGVWRALEEFGITRNLRAIAGTSVGALNAALVAQRDYNAAEYLWQHISPSAVMTIGSEKQIELLGEVFQNLFDNIYGVYPGQSSYSVKKWIKYRLSNQGFLNKEGLSTLIDENISFDKLQNFPGAVYVTAYNITQSKVIYFNLHNAHGNEGMKDRLLASASIPIIFDKTYVDGELYLDGGLPIVGDNLPIWPLYRDGYRNFIVIHLTREEPVNRALFPDSNIIEIMPQDDLGGMIKGVMNFTSETARQNIARGYRDAVAVLRPLYQMGKAMQKTEAALYSIGKEQYTFKQQFAQKRAETEAAARNVDELLQQLQ